METGKRWLALVVAAVFLLGLIPAGAEAPENTESAGETMLAYAEEGEETTQEASEAVPGESIPEEDSGETTDEETAEAPSEPVPEGETDAAATEAPSATEEADTTETGGPAEESTPEPAPVTALPEASDTPEPAVTDPADSPVPEGTPAPETTPEITGAPSEAPEATETPAKTPEETPVETPTMDVTPQPTEGEADPDSSEEPAEPTEAPTATPDVTEAPTDAPDAEPTPEATEEPWDESSCDHANEHCEQAPVCEVPDCAHIGTDIFGLDIPLCELGRWLLDRQDALSREGNRPGLLKAARAPVTLDLSLGSCVIYRSGVYRVQPGETQSGNIEIAENRLVVLQVLEGVAGTLRLQAGSQAVIHTGGQVSLAALIMAENTRVTLAGSGAGRVNAVSLTLGEAPSEVLVEGGSWFAQGFTEGNGKQLHMFPARGTTGATLEGEALDYTMCDADGRAYLYLPDAPQGYEWKGEVDGDTLVIVASMNPTEPPKTEVPATDTPEAPTKTPEPEPTPTPVPELPIQILPGTDPTEEPPEVSEAPAETETPENGEPEATEEPESTPSPAPEMQEICLEAGQTSTVSDYAEDTCFAINEPGCTLVLDGGSLDVSRIRADTAYTLRVTEAAEIRGSLTLASIAAEAPLTILGGADASVAFQRGNISCTDIPGGYAVYTLSHSETIARVLINGEAVACLHLSSGELLLPVYEIGEETSSRQGETLSVFRVNGEAFPQQALAEQADFSGMASFAVSGDGRSQSGTLTLQEGTATACFSHIQLYQEGPVIRLTNEDLTLVCAGDNALISQTAVLEKDEASRLQLSVPSGRLLMQQQSLVPGMTLRGNVKLVPEVETDELLVVTVLSRSGQPLANMAVTVRIGEETHDWITHYDGTLCLWGFDAGEQDIAITDGLEVYRAVVRSGKAEAAPEMAIEDITVTDLADGVMEVRFRAEEAKTAGVSFIVAQQARDLPDTFVERAEIVYATDGVARLENIDAGMTVTLRVFAATAENAHLTSETADGFSFSDIVRHVHRAPFTISGSLDRTYTGKAYVLPITLPEGAKVNYSGENLQNGMPVMPGRYVLKVVLPEGNETYLPGECKKEFSITKIRLQIVPEPNQEKYAGEEDPELLWTATGLLEGDEIEGELTREPGEEPGNYAFDISELSAPEWYTLSLAEDVPVFTILPNEWEWDEDFDFSMPYFYTGEVLHPVQQEIVRTDGRKLSVMLQATETLQIGYGNLGQPVFDTRTRESQIFTPSLSWSAEQDTLLLRLRTEPEINKDKGYATDIDGNPVWGGRTLRLSWQTLEYMDRIGIDAISLVNAGASITLSVHELLSAQMQELIRSHNWTLAQTSFQAILVPSSQTPDDVLARRPLTDGWTMGLYAGNGSENVDITEHMESLLAAVDLEPVARLMDSVGRYDAMTFGEGLEVIGSMDPSSPLPSRYVQPATPEETEICSYGRLMYNHRYLLTGLKLNDTLYCINAGKAE